MRAYLPAKANKGGPGVDGETFADIESGGPVMEWLRELGKELHDKTYRPQPVRRKMIQKQGGGERPLGIPTIRDRVAQTAAKLIVEPIFEADLEPNAYGYRPKRSAQDAVEKVDELLHQGYTDIVDADLSKYFDTASYCPLIHEICSEQRWLLINPLLIHGLYGGPCLTRDDTQLAACFARYPTLSAAKRRASLLLPASADTRAVPGPRCARATHRRFGSATERRE